MSLSNASSQTLSAPASPGFLAATPTWDPRINPNPEWLHLDGVSGMQHLVEAARARFGPGGHEYVSGPALGGGEATPPGSGSPAPLSPALRQPPPWMTAPPLTRSNALRITTHQEFTAEELDYGWPSIVAPRVGAARPHFMEPLTTGSSAVASPVDRGVGGPPGGAPPDHIAAVMLRDYYPGLVTAPPGPAVPFVPQEPAILPPSTPIPGEQ